VSKRAVSRLDRNPRERATAAAEVVRLIEGLQRSGTSLAALVCRGEQPVPWKIYPGEYGLFDPSTGGQLCYHAHADWDHEVGHFHTFRYFTKGRAHIVGISMAPSGWPQALFTVNLWGTRDLYRRPETLKQYARRFHVAERSGYARVIRFVNLMVRAFVPEIEQLQDEREARLAAHRRAHPGVDPFEDRSLLVLSRVEIDVRDHCRYRHPARQVLPTQGATA
jgi:hypothetical protein